MDIVLQINPDHKKSVRYENWKKELYILVLRAIYGCIESALQWYKIYSETLMKKGFELNKYGIFVANNLVNETQCTLVQYVDN